MPIRLPNGPAVRFSGTAKLPSDSHCTMMGWFRRRGNTTTYAALMSLENGTTTEIGGPYFDSTGTGLGLAFGTGVNTFSVSPAQDRWFFVACTIATGAMNGYWAYPGDDVFQTLTGSPSAATPTDLSIGASYYGGSGGNGFDGEAAHVRAYDRLLSAAEIMREMRAGGPPVSRADLKFYAAFANADDVIDRSGNGLHGIPWGTGTITTARTDFRVPPRFDSAARRRLFAAVAAGGSVTLGQPSETDTAQPLTANQSKALGQASETDTAQPVTARQPIALGQPSETDTAQALASVRQAATLGQASETDLAQAVTALTPIALGQPSESDTAQPLAQAKQSATLGQPSESDTAQPLSAAQRVTLGQPSESDSAQQILLGGSGTAVGQASETDTAQALAQAKQSATLGQPTETDSAQPLSAAQSRALGQPAETDTAQPLAQAKQAVALGQPAETDTAQPVGVTQSGPQSVTLGQASETDTAMGIAPVGGLVAAAPPSQGGGGGAKRRLPAYARKGADVGGRETAEAAEVAEIIDLLCCLAAAGEI